MICYTGDNCTNLRLLIQIPRSMSELFLNIKYPPTNSFEAIDELQGIRLPLSVDTISHELNRIILTCDRSSKTSK